MTIDPKIDAKRAFDGKDAQAASPAPPDVPERIRQDAPKPVLRPGGSWAARADAVDQAVREGQDASKARNEWKARIKVRKGRGMGMGFRRAADGDAPDGD